MAVAITTEEARIADMNAITGIVEQAMANFTFNERETFMRLVRQDLERQARANGR